MTGNPAVSSDEGRQVSSIGLEDIVRAKEAVNRPKDSFHVQVIRDTMRAKREVD